MATENQSAPSATGQGHESTKDREGQPSPSATSSMERGTADPARAISRRASREASGIAPALLGGSPFAMMRRMFDDMDRLFGGYLASPARDLESSGVARMWSPAVEMFEREGKLVVRAELPGLKNDDVRIEVNDGALVLEGERRAERQTAERGFYRSERSYGSFRREIPLPEDVDPDRAEASFDSGVLEVTLPLDERRRKGKRIEVKRGGSTPSVH